MIMKTVVRPETEMKESGLQWLGEIPNDWKVSRVGNFFSFSSGDSLTNEEIRDEGMYLVYGANGIRGYYSKYNLAEKRILLGRVGALAGNVHIVDGKVWVTEHALIASNKLDLVEEYYGYVFESMNLIQYSKSSAQPVISGDTLQKLRFPVPKLSEQQAIADYLDETCSKIDEIIAEAKASIDEYEKLKQATIDENILGYDSVHIKLRQLGSLKNGLNFSHSDDVANIKFLGVGCFKDNMILSEVDDFADEHIDFEISEEYLLSDGDIVFVRSNGSKELVGRSIMVENIDYPVTFSGFCIRFRNMHTELVDNRFLLYYFRTTHFKQSLLKYSNDSTNINNLNQEMLNAIRINAPVIAEQKLLVKKMEEQVFVFDSLIAEKESLIKDLESYKKSLIYEVVTGKRRVV